MVRLAALRPHRRLALPFVLLFGPLLWFIARDVSVTADPVPLTAAPRFVALTVLATVGSYIGAALIFVFVLSRSPSNSRATEMLLEPDDATLAVFAALIVASAGYLVASMFAAIPWWVDLLAAPVGILIGFPLVAIYAGFVAVGNAIPALQHGIAPFVAVGVGVACSALWAFLFSSLLTRKLGS